jgi:hypothetical protein
MALGGSAASIAESLDVCKDIEADAQMRQLLEGGRVDKIPIEEL